MLTILYRPETSVRRPEKKLVSGVLGLALIQTGVRMNPIYHKFISQSCNAMAKLLAKTGLNRKETRGYGKISNFHATTRLRACPSD